MNQYYYNIEPSALLNWQVIHEAFDKACMSEELERYSMRVQQRGENQSFVVQIGTGGTRVSLINEVIHIHWRPALGIFLQHKATLDIMSRVFKAKKLLGVNEFEFEDNYKIHKERIYGKDYSLFKAA